MLCTYGVIEVKSTIRKGSWTIVTASVCTKHAILKTPIAICSIISKSNLHSLLMSDIIRLVYLNSTCSGQLLVVHRVQFPDRLCS